MQHIKTNTALVALARQNARNLLVTKGNSVLGYHHTPGGISNRGRKSANSGAKLHGSRLGPQSPFSSASSGVSLIDKNHKKAEISTINSFRSRGEPSSSNFVKNNNNVNGKSTRNYSTTATTTASTSFQQNPPEIFNSSSITGNGGESVQQRSSTRSEMLIIRDYNDQLVRLKQRGLPKEMEKLLEEMKSKGVQPNTFTYNLMLDTLASFRNETNKLDKLMQYFDEMIKNNVQPNLSTYSIMIKALCKREYETQTKIYQLKKRLNTGNEQRGAHIQKSIDNLREEKCVETAYNLFLQTKDRPGYFYESDLCDSMLRSFSSHGRIEEGLTIFEYMENRGIVSGYTFGYLIAMYSHAGDMESALECFNEYKNVEPRLPPKYEPMAIYNQLISAYLRCDRISEAVNVLENLVPMAGLKADEWTYFYLIRDLCDGGNIEEAQRWFDKMKNNENLPKPFLLIYDTMLLHYSGIGDYTNATKIYQEMQDLNLTPKYTEMACYLSLTLRHNPDKLLDLLDDMLKCSQVTDNGLTKEIVNHFLETKKPAQALSAIIKIIALTERHSSGPSNRSIISPPNHEETLISLFNNSELTLKEAIDAKFLLFDSGYRPMVNISNSLLERYERLKRENLLAPQLKELENHHIYSLFDNVTSIWYGEDPKSKAAFKEKTFEILESLQENGITLPYKAFTKIHHHFLEISDNEGAEKWKQMSSKSLSNNRAQEETATSVSSNNIGRQPTIQEINRSSQIAQMCKTHTIDSVALMNEIRQMLNEGLIPTPEVVSQAIRNLGKGKMLSEAEELYNLALDFFKKLDPSVGFHALQWSRNSMLIAYACNSRLDDAYRLYDELFESGSKPDANAYADLLVAEGDRDPDEAATALKLYAEIKQYNIKPTLYFYNVLISKLGKARKYDIVWEAFNEMKARKIQPNSITYGALITACTRVKSEERALLVLQEMENSRFFQPRIGPYNTMMQFYTWDLHEREKALKYFGEIQRLQLQPSDHTYKLLIDAYATIEPYDMSSALNVLEQMRRDGKKPQPTHYASIIYAYGHCQNDVQNALQTFNDMLTVHGVQPDQNAYQALFDTLISNDRIVEAEEYYDVMITQNIVKSTPYIENLFIKGYGQLGQWERAETVFTNMIDLDDVDNYHGVPREPSTYEEMVKAYVINGQIEKAKEVASILERKDFPEIVKNNIADLLR
ncbi:8074_t:CDS:1 [Acaulospora morrowiae]|uniref:8074_t:CDS:1 n=1 Tax=Acaulospora morrowiae TaxID=94023 RepID=A0A9N8VL75_9GLOM|nr:8074_t:CDS:1 [Acaulospora morrowiae]